MEHDTILNARNKQEYLPMHTAKYSTTLTILYAFLCGLLLLGGCRNTPKTEESSSDSIAMADSMVTMADTVSFSDINDANDNGSEVRNVRFSLDLYGFADKDLEQSIEKIIEEQLGSGDNLPLEILFEHPCGLILNYDKENDRDSVVAKYEIDISTLHYSYSSYDILENLPKWYKGCCMLAGHLCYIRPDSHFVKTGKKKEISFYADNTVCPCAEEDYYLDVKNGKAHIISFSRHNYRIINSRNKSFDSLFKQYQSIHE